MEYNNANTQDYNDMSTYEEPDLKNWKPPRILHFEDENGQDHLYPFDPKNVVFGVMKQRPNNSGATVSIEYHLTEDGRDQLVPLMLQTPKMRSMFGLSSREFQSKQGKVESGTRLDLTFRDKDKYPAMAAFFAAMFLLDQHILNAAKQNVAKWFSNAKQLQKQLSVIDCYYKANTRPRERKSDRRMFPPTLTMKARKLRSGGYNFNCYNEALTLIPGDSIVPQSDVIAKFEVTGLWFTDNSFGQSTELREVMLYKSKFRKTPSIVQQRADDAEEDHQAIQHILPSPLNNSGGDLDDESPAPIPVAPVRAIPVTRKAEVKLMGME